MAGIAPQVLCFGGNRWRFGGCRRFLGGLFGRSRGGFGGDDGLRGGGRCLGGELLPLVIIEAAATFLNFVRLLSHKRRDLLREMDSESSLVPANGNKNL